MDYLKQQKGGHAWYVRVIVPDRLRAAIGKREYWVPLGTQNKAVARERSHGAIAAIKAELKAAEGSRTFPPESVQYVQEVAKEAGAAVQKGLLSEDAAAVRFDVALDKHLDQLRAKHGEDADGDPLVTERHRAAVHTASRVARGEKVAMLADQIKQYIAEVTPAVRAQTVQDKLRVYGALQKWLVTDCEVKAITRKDAGDYVSTVLAKQGRAPKTLRSELAQLSALWSYMLGRGVVESNVWTLMSTTLPKSTRGSSEGHRRPWTEDELLRYFKETPTDDPMWATAALSLYGGGMRIEEVCRLKVADYHDGALHIRAAKSSAGVRSVPVHPVIQPLVKRLASTSNDGYLVPGLLIAGRDAKRSVYLSKRIAWHLRKVLKLTDKGLVMHGLRHTFTNACEGAGIPLTTAQLLVGHSRRGSITYGAAGASYSHGLPLEQLAKAIAKVHFGKLDGIVRGAARSLKVTHKSARRYKRKAAGELTRKEAK